LRVTAAARTWRNLSTPLRPQLSKSRFPKVTDPVIRSSFRPGRRRIHETTIERQDASAIHRRTPRQSCEDDRDGARTGEQAHSERLRWGLVWGTIGWTIPLSRYPDTYNKQPICYVALSSQKNYCWLYLMGAFWSASQLEQLEAAFKAAGKKLDMGKCCVHFESPDDLPLEAIGKLISAISSEKWIEMHEQSRLMTKAGQAQMAKQGAPSASKGAAKRVDTKRRR
jgi:hypothetical protein